MIFIVKFDCNHVYFQLILFVLSSLHLITKIFLVLFLEKTLKIKLMILIRSRTEIQDTWRIISNYKLIRYLHIYSCSLGCQ